MSEPADDVEQQARELGEALVEMGKFVQRTKSHRDLIALDGRGFVRAVDYAAELIQSAISEAHRRGRESAEKWQKISTAPETSDVSLYCPNIHGNGGPYFEVGLASLWKDHATHWQRLPEPPHDK